MNRRLITLLFILVGFGPSALASTYIEAGTSLSRMSSASAFFQDPAAAKTGTGFMGNFAVYIPVTKERRLVHLDLGFDAHLLTNSSSSGNSLAMASLNAAARIEASRFFVGGGFSPIDFVSKNGGGVTSLHTYPRSHSYFVEGGVIWRVVPEFQIAAAYDLEFASTPAGSSPNPASAFGLRFQFPLIPRESGGKGAIDFDGFRYPFGVMR